MMEKNKKEKAGELFDSPEYKAYEKRQHDAWIKRGKRREFPSDDSVLKIVHELREMYESTNPYKRKKSEKGKHNTAKWAIKRVTSLRKNLCGWAEDHLQGIAFSYYQRGEKQLDNLNSHEHEHFFEKNENKNWEPSPEAVRASIAIILEEMHSSLHDKVGFGELGKALLAYNEGEIHYIFKRTKKKTRSAKGNKPTLDFLKWIAICYVHLLRGFGEKQESAREIIAGHLGITKYALHKWEKEIGKKQDPQGEIEKKIRIYTSESKSLLKNIDPRIKQRKPLSSLDLWESIRIASENKTDEMKSYLDFIRDMNEGHPLNQLKKNILLASLPAGTVTIYQKQNPIHGVYITTQ